jgi:hypothetical protein
LYKITNSFALFFFILLDVGISVLQIDNPLAHNHRNPRIGSGHDHRNHVVARDIVNEITENIVSAVHVNNQLTVNAINAAAENFRTLNRTIDSVTEFNTGDAKAWNSFLTAQQQQFFHKQ